MREPLPQSPEEQAEDEYWTHLYGPWAALDLAGAVEFFDGFDRPWWLVGGWAIEAFTGAPREHEDIDVSILASGEAVVEAALWCSVEGGPAVPEDPVEAGVLARAQRAVRISGRTLARIHPGLSAPTLVALVRLPRWQAGEVLTAAARLVLVADGIEYAGNLGTLVRTADACAADAVVLTNATARVTNPKTFVASRGTVLTMPVLEYDSVALARADLAGAGFTTYVADPAAGTSYRCAGLGCGPTAVVVGSEGEGVSPEWRDGPARVSIPMRGTADSLNVAASAAVLMFEARAGLDRG